jgi:hypothetical protein
VRQEKAADNSVDIAGRQHEQRKIRRLRVIKLVSKQAQFTGCRIQSTKVGIVVLL